MSASSVHHQTRPDKTREDFNLADLILELAFLFYGHFLYPPHYGPEWRNISKAYECAFGSEVAETTERTQAISQENVFLKPICEQNSIV